MKTITLEEAHKILENCAGVIADNCNFAYRHMADLEGSDENQFLYLSWDDNEGQCYDIKFAEGENKEVKVSGSSMFLIDIEGDEEQLTILQEANLE